MLDDRWVSWKMQTSKKWADIEDVLEYTNIDFIDFDHKILLEYALKLNVLIHRSDKEFSLELLEEIGLMLQKLYGYAVEHFDREEEFMKTYDLPNVAAHLREHADILDMLRQALNDFKKGKVNISHELKMQVMEWLIHHINKIDNDFFQIENWSEHLVGATDWEEVSHIVSLTGINEIDHQHKMLTEKAINIMTNINESSTKETLNRDFSDFRDYVVYHFDFETEFMNKYNIKDKTVHLEQHDYFVERLEAFPNEILDNPHKVDDFKKWILTWWINHINITDQETFNYDNWATLVIDKAEKLEDIQELLRLTGIDTIDHDHLEVMGKTFELYKLIQTSIVENSLQEPHIKTEIIKILKAIYIRAEQHFHREETIMDKYDFSDIGTHSLEHKDILDKISNMIMNYEENRLYASKNIKTVILDWWIHHTNNNDYRTFVLNITKDKLVLIKREEMYE